MYWSDNMRIELDTITIKIVQAWNLGTSWFFFEIL